MLYARYIGMLISSTLSLYDCTVLIVRTYICYALSTMAGYIVVRMHTYKLKYIYVILYS